MILSRKFVSEYIDIPETETIKDIADKMTNVGNEYDYASKYITASNLVIGEVLECIPHPDSDHMHCTKVNIGSETLDIVCGAPNVRKGIKVIVALNGAVLPGGEIKKSVIRGCESNGMLCSLSEIGIDNKYLTEEDKKGIHELGDDAIVGEDPIKYMGLDDEIVDFELTSNRGDLLSVLGLSYELGAIYNSKVKDIDLTYNENGEDINNSFKLDVKTDDCPLFLGRIVRNVEIKESPAFIKERLMASGIRPINNVVDISNYVMLETGQPLHYYDLDKLGNNLIVRNASLNEHVLTLDNIDRELTSEDIVIANKNSAIGLAGVMGGFSTEVDENTKNIFVESAIFDNVKIRKTSKKILRSEASNRFEKGLDPNRTYMAMDRSMNLLSKYASGEVQKGMVQYKNIDIKEEVINITVEKINKVLGLSLTKDEIINIFERLEFKVNDKNDYLEVVVPTRRIDIHIVEDLIEEVGRIYGMDNIHGKLPKFDSKLGKYNKTRRELKHKLCDLGLNETLSYSLISENEVKTFTNDNFEPIKLNDPMSEDKNTLRYSLLPSLMSVYEYNKARNNKDISIFEIGKSFFKEDNTYKEENHLAILMSGEYYLGINKTNVDFYILKGIVEEILDFLGFENRYSFDIIENPIKELHPYVSASLVIQGINIGILGKVHPNVNKDDIYVFEINLDKLNTLHPSRMAYKEIPKFPSIQKDVAFVMDKNINSLDIEKEIKKAGGKLLVKIEVFDLYTGEHIEEGKKSIAYNLTYQDMNRTLTEEEVMASFNNVITSVNNKFKTIVRS